MGSPGNIEKVMVAGILFIIVGILAVAIYGSHDKQASASGQSASLNSQESKNSVPPAMRMGGTPGKTGDDVEAHKSDGNSGFVVAADQDLENSKNIQSVEIGKFDDVTSPRKNPEAETPKAPEVAKETPKVEPEKGPEIPDSYTVVSGDSFSKIAEKVFGDRKYAADIQKANPTIQPTKLLVDQKIKLPKIDVAAKPAGDGKSPSVVEQPDTKTDGTEQKPAVRTHTIQAGDKLTEISRKYYKTALKADEIAKLNKDIIKDKNKLPVGKTIRLP